jgi:hypothetical protein
MSGFRKNFDMVSKWWMRQVHGTHRADGRQSKIYSESNQSDFSRIFGALSSMQSLAIYR